MLKRSTFSALYGKEDGKGTMHIISILCKSAGYLEVHLNQSGCFQIGILVDPNSSGPEIGSGYNGPLGSDFRL